MRMRSLLVLIAATVLLGATPGGATDTKLHIDVSPRISRAPAQINIRAVVIPSSENRGLRISADSGDFFRSSYVPLDGADAATVTQTSFKNLPGGDYEVSVALVDSQGHVTSTDRRMVMVASSAE